MTDVLKKMTAVCCCSALLACCAGCDADIEPPDTLEAILGVQLPEQETVATETDQTTETSETEYQSIFFGLESATETETDSIAETEGMTQTESITEPSPIAETESVIQTEPVTEAETTICTTVGTTDSIETETEASVWEQAYRTFLEASAYDSYLPDNINLDDVKFLLLYINNDSIPELCIQTTSNLCVYTYMNESVLYVNSFPVSHYTYDFYYRPYLNCLCSLQGSVMSDGTYLDIWEYDYDVKKGFVLKQEYCAPTREYSYEVYSEMGLYIDDDALPSMDIHMDRETYFGSSWFTVPDVLESDSMVYRYEITDENLDIVFGADVQDNAEMLSDAEGD